MSATTYPGSAPCILPPHILRSIAGNGTPEQRNRALRTLATDQTQRMERATYQLLGFRTRSTLISAGPAEKRRTVYTASNHGSLPGRVVRDEGGAPAGDAAVDEAYDGLGATFDFFLEAYARNSVDDEGLHLDATVHYETDYDNAFWNGRQMIFGDGDGDLFNRFTVSLDVIGHELTHGVTGDEAQLLYLGQSGALNESISDVFGSLVKQYSLRQTAAEADWLIGAGLFTAAVHGVALRSMKQPGTAFDDRVLGKDPQPGHMRDFVSTSADNGGVHVNSGIPNRAFYLVATDLGGSAWEKAGRTWYETLRDPRLRRSATFAQFAERTVANASRLYGAAETKIVTSAWRQVGVAVP